MTNKRYFPISSGLKGTDELINEIDNSKSVSFAVSALVDVVDGINQRVDKGLEKKEISVENIDSSKEDDGLIKIK